MRRKAKSARLPDAQDNRIRLNGTSKERRIHENPVDHYKEAVVIVPSQADLQNCLYIICELTLTTENHDVHPKQIYPNISMQTYNENKNASTRRAKIETIIVPQRSKH
ncbi:hypothetical protein DPMN_159635 [Dreissena polymorpha]|uniref:Uncharacterized protein n=1 Tax=Dreissena polymorpha TaxID=45954 RepID=A0A9D4IN14_DREPO|nr:hypothetical protein DPMN_159635 [Dreissena polymorpha]